VIVGGRRAETLDDVGVDAHQRLWKVVGLAQGRRPEPGLIQFRHIGKVDTGVARKCVGRVGHDGGSVRSVSRVAPRSAW